MFIINGYNEFLMNISRQALSKNLKYINTFKVCLPLLINRVKMLQLKVHQ